MSVPFPNRTLSEPGLAGASGIVNSFLLPRYRRISISDRRVSTSHWALLSGSREFFALGVCSTIHYGACSLPSWYIEYVGRRTEKS